MTTEGLHQRFMTLPPREEAAKEMRRWRADFASFAEMVDESVPDSREKSTALTKLEEAKYFVNQAIILADNAAARDDHDEAGAVTFPKTADPHYRDREWFDRATGPDNPQA